MQTPWILEPIAIVTTTVGSAADAQRLAQAAVQARVAACVQIEAIDSHYAWQGKLAHEPEWRLLLKTRPDAAEAALSWLQAAHPYEVPQLLLRTEHANAAYAAWVAAQVDVKK